MLYCALFSIIKQYKSMFLSLSCLYEINKLEIKKMLIDVTSLHHKTISWERGMLHFYEQATRKLSDEALLLSHNFFKKDPAAS